MVSRRRTRYVNGVDRRSFIGSGLAAAGLAAGGPFARTLAQDVRLATESRPVTTSAGRVRGVVLPGGVNAFYGIPYGAPTSGSNRFMPPADPEPWTGERPADLVGNRAPQDESGPISEVYALDRREPMGEDCLNLNVFTPALSRGDRPVMVWLHGGGYSSGSGNWLLYDGARLALSQDVVVVPVTHRLNVFGFLHLAELGDERFAESSNVGMLDIVHALRWVRDNIDRFGGDPGNVTIFGQSGGAGKVSTLMAMPSAEGLFHRAIAMSGSEISGVPLERAVETSERFMAEVGASTPARLQTLPMDRLRRTMTETQGLALSPAVDGASLPSAPFDPAAPEATANVPMMLSSTRHEVNFFPFTPREAIDDNELASRVQQTTEASPAEAADLIALYREHQPRVSNTELYQIIASDNSFRVGVTTEAELKAEQDAAPVYMYYFTWESPVREGRLRSYHCLDIPFAFNNVEVATSMTGAGQDRYELATRMSTAFANFARSGDPNSEGLPDWPAFDLDRRATMVLDNACEVVDDPNGAERRALAELRASSGDGSSA